MNSPERVRSDRRSAILVAATCLILAGLAFVVVRTWERNLVQARFLRASAERVSLFDLRVDEALHQLWVLKRFHESSDTVTRPEFERFLRPVFARHPEIRQLLWVRRDGGSAPTTVTGGTDRPAAFELTADGALVPSRSRPVHYVITYTIGQDLISPGEGFDMASVPAYVRALETARDSGRPVVSRRIDLSSGSNERWGYLAQLAVYRPSDEQRSDQRADLQGFVLAVFDVGASLEAAISSLVPAGIDMEVRDLSAPIEDSFLYRHAPAVSGMVGEPAATGSDSPFRYNGSFAVGDRVWEVRCTTTPAFLAANRLWTSWVVLAVGLILSGWATLYVFSTRRHASRIEALVEARTAKLNESQKMLQQAQKMEAVGQLAGGVAHDFNNLLTSITGNVALAMLRLPADDPISVRLEEIQATAMRASHLIRQLLAFSRRQIVEPTVCDLNAILDDLQAMLARIIGEHIQLVVRAARDLGRIRIDRSQLEQVLLNICINARDAMPGGGTLTIETANVELDQAYCESRPHITPGPKVQIVISDTGCGMDEETRSRAFEPFFTTKPEGKGTGLGLATVYGAVTQNEGSIEVYSEPGNGTTFKVYFPRVDDPPDPHSGAFGSLALPPGDETILFVEDEEAVRDMAVEVLRHLGYTVLVAADAESALQLAATSLPGIDLLMTDVVMPGINGRELAERLRAERPGLRVLYTSGYTADVISHHGVLDQGITFLPKPYSPQSLAHKLRQVLSPPT